jgi:hypothetical protein
MSTSESSSQSPKTTSEILAYIHEWYLKLKQDDDPSPAQWDCVLEKGVHQKEWDVELNE